MESTTTTAATTKIILLHQFVINKKFYRLFYHTDVLVWEKERKNSTKSTKKITLPICDIISIKLPNNKITPNATGQLVADGHFSINNDLLPQHSGVETTAEAQRTADQNLLNHFILYYAKATKSDSSRSNKWQQKKIKFYHKDSRIIQLWYETIRKALNDQKQRPHNLLLFINPFGGRQNALHIYEKYAKPMFRIADVDVDVVVSQRPNQIRDIIGRQSLDRYDGICCVGGDGTFSEVFNGLIYRTINDLGLDPKYPAYIPEPTIPIGIIPGGSTDTVAYCLHGTTDIQTAVIHIILGQQSGLDLASVHNGAGSLMCMYASVMSYGYLGDVAADSENFRWMGPKRYDYSGFKKFFLNRCYEGEVSMLMASGDGADHCDKEMAAADAMPEVMCLENCKHCLDALERKQSVIDMMDKSAATAAADTSKIVKGQFFMVNGANISCACTRSPNGFSKYCHLGDGCLHLILIRHTTFLNNLKLLWSLSSKTGQISKLPFVEIYRVRQFQFRKQIVEDRSAAFGSTQPIGRMANDTQPYCSLWNCDGEIIHEADITVQSHCQLIKVYRHTSPSVSQEWNAGAQDCRDGDADQPSSSTSSTRCWPC